MWHGRHLLGPLAAAAVLATAAPAWAGTSVSLSGATLEVASGGEGNNVSITVVGANLRVAESDVNIAVTPGSGCAQNGANAATCPKAGVTLLHVVLGDGYDTLTIDPAITVDANVSGGTGNDTLKGGGGDDTLDGGSEDDVLQGFGGGDTLIGGTGSDLSDYRERTAGQSVTVTLNAGTHNDGAAGENDDAQTDNAIGGAGDDNLTGDANPNQLNGQDGADTIHGGDGGDTLDGGFNGDYDDHLFGEGGGDLLEGWAGDDELNGGDGNDDIRGREGDDTLTGGPGNDTLRGHEGHNDVSAGDGDDFLAPGGGGGLADGGPGYDQADMQEAGGMTLTLDGVANDTGGNGGTYNVENIERLDMGFSADTVTGSNADEVINTNGGNDIIHAGGGDDVIDGGQNADLMDGGPGYDIASFGVWSSNNCQISLDGVANDGGNGGGEGDNVLTEGVAACGDGGTIVGDAGPNVLIGANNGPDTMSGGGGDDLLQGNGNNDTLNGGDGADVLQGGENTDTLHGDAGDDLLDGGNGADVLDGGAGTDTTDYSSAFTALTITLDGAANDPAGDNVMTEVVRGGSAADTITGSAGADRLYGGPGNDQLHGAGGDDALIGEGGADLLDGGPGEDAADYSGAGGSVTVRLNGAADDGYAGEGDNAQVEDVLGGDFSDTLIGDGGANVLAGGAGGDTLDGAAGNDELIGGPGVDAVTTGAGTDTVRVQDGEADAVACDLPSGKTVESDAIDKVSNCGTSPTGVTELPGGDVSAPAEAATLVLAGGFLTPAPTTTKARKGSTLAKALDGEPARGATVKLSRRGNVLDLGDLECTGALRCALKVIVKAAGGRHKVLARGSASVPRGSVSALAKLTKDGRKALRGRHRVRVVATFSLTEGAAHATKTATFSLRRLG